MELYISDFLKESITKKDIYEIRSALIAYVDIDPAFKTNRFLDAISYVEKQGFSVYAPHDPELSVEENIPAKDRFYQIQTSLYSNFSRERVQELIRVGRSCMKEADVYKVTAASLNSGTSVRSDKSDFGENGGLKKDQGQNSGMAAGRRWIIIALVAVLAVVLILLLCLKAPGTSENASSIRFSPIFANGVGRRPGFWSRI